MNKAKQTNLNNYPLKDHGKLHISADTQQSRTIVLYVETSE